MFLLFSSTWPWYVAGPLLGFVMLALILLGKNFGVSSTLRTCCGMLGAGKRISFFDFDWKSQLWNIVFVLGGLIGGIIASLWFPNLSDLNINPSTVQAVNEMGFPFQGELLPSILTDWSDAFSYRGMMVIVLGGFFVGFGARWAGGCTSGHAISGLSNLQLPSLIAVIGFFIGGLIMSHLLLPLFFNI